MAKEMTVEDADRFMRVLKLLLAGVLVLLVAPLIVYAFYLDRRLDVFEATLEQSSPQELETDEDARGDLSYAPTNAVEGQVVYVPAYSHVYHAGGKPYLLTITLSIRNTSMDSAIVVKSLRYYDTQGKEVKSYLEKPVRLPGLGTTEVVIERDDATGGSGANFLVEWYATTAVTEPIIEAVMVSTNSQQGISFVRRGSVISQVVPDTQITDE